MPEAPIHLVGLFIFITIGLWYGFRISLMRGIYQDGSMPASKGLMMSFIIGVWLAGVAMMSNQGLLQDFDKFPPMILVVVGMSLIMTIAVAQSRIGLLIIKGAGITWLVGFQGFRVLVEVFLHQMYLEGVVPEQMTYSGLNFDILAGLSALVMAYQFSRKKVGAKAIFVWNVLGLLLLINIVVIAILSMPLPFQLFFNEPANTFVTYVPYIWLPTFHVQAALFGHLLIFRALSRGMVQD
ncbi:MAG: hypothetical protein P8L44_10840 [Opitutales bacterium]|jgi:hypothetical protein|nr:hypothetical protein [Opitutales bacterium]